MLMTFIFFKLHEVVCEVNESTNKWSALSVSDIS